MTPRISVVDNNNQASSAGGGDNDDGVPRLLWILLIVALALLCCLCCILFAVLHHRRNKTKIGSKAAATELEEPMKAWAWDTGGEQLGSRRSSIASIQLEPADLEAFKEPPVPLPGAVVSRRQKSASTSSEPSTAETPEPILITDLDVMETPRRSDQSIRTPRGSDDVLATPPRGQRQDLSEGPVTTGDHSPDRRYLPPSPFAVHAATPNRDMRESLMSAARDLNQSLNPAVAAAGMPLSPTLSEASYI